MAAKAGARKPKVRVVPQDLGEVVDEVLKGVAGLKFSGLKKQLPAPYQPFLNEAKVIVEERLKEGTLFEFGKTRALFARPPHATLDAAAKEHLGSDVLAKPALKTLLGTKLPELKSSFEGWFKHAVDSGVLFSAPLPGKKTGKGYTARFDLERHLAGVYAALDACVKDLDALKVERRRVVVAIAKHLGVEAGAAQIADAQPAAISSEERELFRSRLATMIREAPRQALFSVRDLRGRLELPKERFDRIALELMRDGKLVLHHHDHPASLSEVERAELVKDAQGNHYIGIAPTGNV